MVKFWCKLNGFLKLIWILLTLFKFLSQRLLQSFEKEILKLIHLWISKNWLQFQWMVSFIISNHKQPLFEFQIETSLLRPIHLYLIFEKSSLKNQVRRTGFLTCKNQFQNWFLQVKNLVRRTWFFKLDFSKIKYRWIGRQKEYLLKFKNKRNAPPERVRSWTELVHTTYWHSNTRYLLCVHGILFPKLFWPTLTKNGSSYWKKHFEIGGWRPRIWKKMSSLK